MRNIKTASKRTFTKSQIKQLEELITLRVSSPRSQQKHIRQQMRDIGFYGGKEFGITGMTLEKFHDLIKRKEITVVDDDKSDSKQPSFNSKEKEDKQLVTEAFTKENHEDNGKSILDLLSHFKMFDPNKDEESKLPISGGNYIILLRESSEIPNKIGKPTFTEIPFDGKSYRVLYTGISSENHGLRNRDYKNHFKGTAGKSTLRKSLGSLFGYIKIPRDKNNPTNGKTTFKVDDEEILSNWMKKNLLLLYYANTNYEKIELELINSLNPPLNMKDNHNVVNMDFRNKLHDIRK